MGGCVLDVVYSEARTGDGDVADDVPEVVSLVMAGSCEGRQGYSAPGSLYISLPAPRVLNSTQSTESPESPHR